MANLGSKAREKGQNYKDLRGLLPLSLTSNEASHVNLRTRDAVTLTNPASKHEQQQLTNERGWWRIHESVRQTIQDALGTVKAKKP